MVNNLLMNPFITIQQCIDQGFDNYFFICCGSILAQPNGFIQGSYLFLVEEVTSRFINSIKSIEIPEGKAIVLYDTGDYVSSSRAFWGFKAAGFDEIKILLRILTIPDGIEIKQGTPPLIKKAAAPYLPFNNEVALTKDDLENKKSFYQQLIQINYIAFDIIDSSGNLLPANDILNFFNDSNIKFSMSRASIVFGKKACLGGILVGYVTRKTVAVVIDEISKPTESDRPKSIDRINNDEKYQSSITGYSVSVDENVIASSKRKPTRDKDTSLCTSCLIM